jgi:hypothetical protein
MEQNMTNDVWRLLMLILFLAFLHRVVVGDVADVSKVHAVSIFSFDVRRLMSIRAEQN